MKIGIDVKLLRSNSAGIKVYLESLLTELQKIDTENEYILFSPSPVSYKLFAKNFSYRILPTRLPGILWQQYELPHFVKAKNIQVFWGPEQTIFLKKLRGVRKVLTVHDFVYRRFPKTMERSVRLITAYFGTRSIRKSDAIVCVSNFTAQELKTLYPSIQAEKIRVISNGIAEENTRTEFSKKEDFLFFSGSLEPRKNLQTLLTALEILAKKNIRPQLKIAGPAGWKNQKFLDQLKNSPIQNSVEILGFVSPQKLCELYQTCRGFVFPTLYEGFGLPALEALQNGARVLVSSHSPMQDFLGPLGIYFDPHRTESLATAIENFWMHPEKASYTKEENEKRLQILKQFSWENSAQKLKSLFENLGENSR